MRRGFDMQQNLVHILDYDFKIKVLACFVNTHDYFGLPGSLGVWLYGYQFQKLPLHFDDELSVFSRFLPAGTMQAAPLNYLYS